MKERQELLFLEIRKRTEVQLNHKGARQNKLSHSNNRKPNTRGEVTFWCGLNATT